MKLPVKSTLIALAVAATAAGVGSHLVASPSASAAPLAPVASPTPAPQVTSSYVYEDEHGSLRYFVIPGTGPTCVTYPCDGTGTGWPAPTSTPAPAVIAVTTSGPAPAAALTATPTPDPAASSAPAATVTPVVVLAAGASAQSTGQTPDFLVWTRVDGARQAGVAVSVTLTLVRYADHSQTNTQTFSGTTDANGDFRFSPVTPPGYDLYWDIQSSLASMHGTATYSGVTATF